MKKTIALASLLALALGIPAAEAAKFYKWTDEKGVTHYTIDPPPAGARSSEVRIKTRSYSNAEEPGAAAAKGTPATGQKAAPGKAAGVKAEAAKEQKPVPKGPEQYAEKCKNLRSNLQAMQEHAQVRVQDAGGEARVLTDDEKNSRLDATQREIKAFCE
ncbi:MAG: DUF4124 domain-containing protein [Pseudomonadota bacterium]